MWRSVLICWRADSSDMTRLYAVRCIYMATCAISHCRLLMSGALTVPHYLTCKVSNYQTEDEVKQVVPVT